MRIVWALVAVLSLLFWSYGVFDMWATLTSWPPYEAQYGAELFAWIQGFPLWRKAIWGMSIALGATGSLLMFTRMRLAGYALFAAFLLMAIGFAYDLTLQDGARQYGQDGLIASGALVAVALLFAVAGFASARKAIPSDKPAVAPTPAHAAPRRATPPATPAPPAAAVPESPASPPAPEGAVPDASPPASAETLAADSLPSAAALSSPPPAAAGNPDEPTAVPSGDPEPSPQDPKPPAV